MSWLMCTGLTPLPRESSDGELKGRRREGLARQGSQEVRLMTFAVCIG